MVISKTNLLTMDTLNKVLCLCNLELSVAACRVQKVLQLSLFTISICFNTFQSDLILLADVFTVLRDLFCAIVFYFFPVTQRPKRTHGQRLCLQADKLRVQRQRARSTRTRIHRCVQQRRASTTNLPTT